MQFVVRSEKEKDYRTACADSVLQKMDMKVHATSFRRMVGIFHAPRPRDRRDAGVQLDLLP
jgi:hypothetical protein